MCKTCPVRIECLGWALTHEEGQHGMWAGYSERKLRRIRGAWKRGRSKESIATIRGLSPFAVGALDELASRGLGWGR